MLDRSCVTVPAGCLSAYMHHFSLPAHLVSASSVHAFVCITRIMLMIT